MSYRRGFLRGRGWKGERLFGELFLVSVWLRVLNDFKKEDFFLRFSFWKEVRGAGSVKVLRFS